MLRKLIILTLAMVLSMPVAGFCQQNKPSFSIDPIPFMDTDELIHKSYTELIRWTLRNGSSSRSNTSRMRFVRLVEVFDSPYTFVSLDVKPPKVRKVYFQVIAKTKVQNPTKEEDIDMFVRIVEVVMEHANGNVKYAYYVAIDKTMSGLPNELKDWVAIKTLEGKQLKKSVLNKDEELPPGAEIVDMKWGYWLAEFIKLYHLNFMESIPSFRHGPKLREAILEELYGEESAGRIGHNPIPIDQSLLWAGIDHTGDQ
ncbi:MAG: hypothetical protein KAS36_07850 [Anaerolineales bacterium]|nr:hypothetical protein [Anaerolineales bacterium]